MQASGADRAFPFAAAVALTLWLPLLVFDLGYPSLTQVLTTPVLLRATACALGACLAVAGILAVGAALVARRLAPRPDSPAASTDVAFCAVAAGSASLVAIVEALGALRGPELWPLTDFVVLALAALTAILFGRLVAAAAAWGAGRLRYGALPRVVGLLAAAVWAHRTGAVLRTTDAGSPAPVPWLIAAGAVVVGVGPRLAAGRRRAALAAAVALVAAGTLPALRLRPARPVPPADPAATPAAAAPHVVVVMIDTWRWDSTDLAAGGLGTTPRLLALAADGSTVFPRASAPAPSTLPSVKALVSGRPASHFGIPGWGSRPPPADAWTLARAFRAAGYATCGLTTNALVQADGFEGGFDDYWAVGAFNNLRRSLFLYGLLARGDYWRLAALAEALHLDKARGDRVVEVFEKWLDRRAAAGPFFAYLHVVEPHSPYRDRGYGLVPESVRDLPQRYSHRLLRRLPIGDPRNARFRDTPEMREIVGRYREEVRDADRLLGRILDALADRGLYDDALVIVVGDHGEEFLEHNGFGHGHDVFEELIHVPLVVRWPRREPFAAMPAEVPTPVSLLDIFPTLTDLLDLPPAPEPFAGRSLRAALAGRAEPAGVISEAVFPGEVRLSYRLGSLKARFLFDGRRLPSEDGEVVVFDVDADPGESAALDLDRPEVVAFLERARPEVDALWAEARSATLRGSSSLPAPVPEDEEDPVLRRLRALGYLN